MRMPAIGFVLLLLAVLLATNCNAQPPWDNGRLVVSQNGRFLQHENGRPFFWQADTAWLLFQKLDRTEVETYLENRRAKSFNFIQAVMLQKSPKVNIYGDVPLVNDNPAEPQTTPGNNPQVQAEYDYWDHVDFVIDKAAEKHIYMAILPTWGNMVKDGRFTVQSAKSFAQWQIRSADVSQADNRAGVTIESEQPGPEIRATINCPKNRTVAWKIVFQNEL